MLFNERFNKFSKRESSLQGLAKALEIEFVAPFEPNIYEMFDEVIESEKERCKEKEQYQQSLPIDSEIQKFLKIAEEKIQEKTRENINFQLNIDTQKLQDALDHLYYDLFVDISYGIDYTIELRERVPALKQENCPALFLLITKIPGFKDYGIEREKHDHFGFHIHYGKIKNDKIVRTNVLFTFNPKETHTLDTLFWEFHHEKALARANPDDFGKKRRRAIYDSCTPHLSKIVKSEFKNPSAEAKPLYPFHWL